MRSVDFVRPCVASKKNTLVSAVARHSVRPIGGIAHQLTVGLIFYVVLHCRRVVMLCVSCQYCHFLYKCSRSVTNSWFPATVCNGQRRSS